MPSHTNATVDEPWFKFLLGKARRGEDIKVDARLSERQIDELIEAMTAVNSCGKLRLRRGDYDKKWLLARALKGNLELE